MVGTTLRQVTASAEGVGVKKVTQVAYVQNVTTIIDLLAYCYIS